MGSVKSKEKHQYLGKVFTALHRIKLPFKDGQGQKRPKYDHVYVEKEYVVCGKMHIECSNVENNPEKKELLTHLGLHEDMTPQTFYLICDKRNAQNARLPDPKYVHNLGTTKWILDVNLETALKVKLCHGQMI